MGPNRKVKSNAIPILLDDFVTKNGVVMSSFILFEYSVFCKNDSQRLAYMTSCDKMRFPVMVHKGYLNIEMIVFPEAKQLVIYAVGCSLYLFNNS
jgi:hypothetical protein